MGCMKKSRRPQHYLEIVGKNQKPFLSFMEVNVKRKIVNQKLMPLIEDLEEEN